MKLTFSKPLRVSASWQLIPGSGLVGVRSPAGRKSPTFLMLLAWAPLVFCGANYRTTNFLVSAPTAQQAQAVAEQAERLRFQLAVDWLDRELDRWQDPCPIRVVVGEHLRPRGETSYVFRQGYPTAWNMHVEGPWSTIYRSVVPHEVAHAVFATHFGRGLPRWAEEGVCVIVEDQRDQQKLEQVFVRHMTDGRMISLARLFTLEVYPADVMALYTQGYSLVRFFVERGGKQKFVHYLDEGLVSRDWHAATLNHYGYQDLQQLQDAWLGWAVMPGESPEEFGPVDALVSTGVP